MKRIKGLDLDMGRELICQLGSVDDSRENYLPHLKQHLTIHCACHSSQQCSIFHYSNVDEKDLNTNILKER